MDANKSYIKYFFILGNVVLTMFIISAGSFIISPLVAALVVAILLNPLYDKFNRLGLPRVISAMFAVIVFIVAVLLLLSFITTQLSYITSDPNLSAGPIVETINSSQRLIAQFFNFSMQDQTQLLAEYWDNFVKQVVTYIPNAFSGTTAYLSMFLLFFISLFFFLYYRNFFMNFVFKATGKKNEDRVIETTNKIESAIKNYIVGLVIVMGLVAMSNSVGLIILGIQHALFFGILGALLTIIPYIGIIIGSLLPALFALITTNSWWYAFGVILIFSFVQFLEGNILTPYIVGRKENINPYFAILGLFIGGMLLGSVGVILAIPILGILKIIFDDIEYLKPVGYVMGNPHRESNILDRLSKLFRRKKS